MAKQLAKKLPLLDAGWLMMETRETPMHVGGLNIYAMPDNAPDDYIEKLFQQLLDVTAFSRPFNQKVRSRVPGGLDAAWISDENFDISYHVRHSALPKPGRVRELLALVSRLHAQVLDRRRPLWEWYLIEGLEGSRFAIYSKMSHAMIDGIGSVRLMQSRMASSPDEKLIPPWSAEWDKLLPTPDVATKPPRFNPLTPLANAARGSYQLGQMMLLPRAGNAKSIYQAPKSLFNTRVSGARRFVAQSWSFSRIKAAGKQHSGTVNDVFLAMCSGALRQYLLSQNVLPTKPLVAQVPVAMRTADAADGGGNAITAVTVSLGTHIADPLKRLAVIQDSMQAAKTRLGGMQKGDIDAFTTLTNLPLSLGQVSGISGRVNPLFNITISNVPGPRETLYLNGAELLANYPISLVWHGYAMNITVLSYRDSLEFGIIACRETVPQVQRLLDYLETALVELE